MNITYWPVHHIKQPSQVDSTLYMYHTPVHKTFVPFTIDNRTIQTEQNDDMKILTA